MLLTPSHPKWELFILLVVPFPHNGTTPFLGKTTHLPIHVAAIPWIAKDRTIQRIILRFT
jgi:hypothetical protein